MRFFCVTPVWGPGHLGLFLDVGLPSLLAPDNLPGLARTDECRFLIYTRAQDEARLREALIFDRLATVMPVEVHLIPEPLSNAHRVMSDCHADAIRRADERDAASIFIPPDCVWADGSMVAVSRIAGSGRSMIHISGIRLDRDAVVPHLRERMTANGTLAIEPRELVKIGLDHLHVIADSHFWNERDGGLMPANLYWTVPGEGLALRCFHLHPLMVKSQVKFAPFKSTIDDDLALFACPDATRDHVVTDSDEILTFELSGPERVIGASFHKGSAESVACWSEVGTNARHHELAKHPIRIHCGPVDAERWAPAEHEAETVIGEVARINRMNSPLLAVRYPAVLIWRYYAMTLGQGRYIGKKPGLSHLVIRLLRRVIHGNRRMRAIFFEREGVPSRWHPMRLFSKAPPSGSRRPSLALVDPIAAATAQRRADAKRARGNLVGALRDYDEAIRISPPNTALHYLRGTALLEAGNLPAAMKDFESGLVLDPENPTLQSLLQQTRTDLDRQGSPAVLDAAAAAELARQGDLKREQGDRPAAIQAYSDAIRISPPNPALHYLRGVTRLETGDAAGAVLDFQTGLKLDPGNPTLRSLILRARATSLRNALYGLAVKRDGRLRMSHPMWLVRRSVLTTLENTFDKASGRVVLLGDDSQIAAELKRARPELAVTGVPSPAVEAWLARPADAPGSLAILDLGGQPADRVREWVRSVGGTRPVVWLGGPQGAALPAQNVTVVPLGGAGTRVCNAAWQAAQRAHGRLFGSPWLNKLPIKVVLVLLLPLLYLLALSGNVIGNLFGLALDRFSNTARG